MSFVMAILIPGPVIMRAWVVWPLFTASNTYLPGLKEFLERAMWKSVSTALTLVVLVDAAAGPAARTVAAPGGGGQRGQRGQRQGADVSDGVHGGPLWSMLL